MSPSDKMHCPGCDDEHAEWADQGTAPAGPDSPAMLDLWDCLRCGYTLEGVVLVTDGGQSEAEGNRCDYCDTDELAYELRSGRGPVVRCIECLAIEQIQQKLSMPFDGWIDRDDVEPPEHPDAPDFEPFDPTEHDYKTARAWATILARLKDDDPILKRDPETHGTVFEDTREFVTNIMGSDAHKRPSELRGGDTDE